MTANWMLDELSHAGPEHLDDAYVSGYDRKAQFDPTRWIANSCAVCTQNIAPFVGSLNRCLHHAGFAIIDTSYQRHIYGAYTCQRQA